jgi:hypothetical protein
MVSIGQNDQVQFNNVFYFVFNLIYSKEVPLEDDDLGVESEDDKDEPLMVRLTICRIILYSYHYSALFEHYHPSDYKNCCTQWPYFSISHSE